MYAKSKYENQNKGLKTDFQLEGGKMVLKGGTEKVDDNISMLLAFVGWFRVFTPDFCINPYQFLHNTTSYMFRFKNVLRLSILKVGKNYVPFAKFKAVDLLLDPTNRKDRTIHVQFQYNLKDVKEYQTIKKVLE
tara:strand:+ start:99 stop:500 length:402 start_codon:yes stop_codon:yes gene_type:complete